MQKMLGNKKAYGVFVIPALVIYLVMAFIPIAMSGYYSTMQWDGIGEKIYIGIDNYLGLMKDEAFLLSARNSLILAVASIVGQLIPALFFALVLARNIKGERAYRTIYFIPVLLSTVVIGQLFLKIYNPDYGALNAILESLGFEGKDWLGDKRYVLASSFFPIIWQYIGYHMLILYTGIKSVPSDIYEAAQIDGANERQIAWHVTIPLIRSTMKVSLTFAVIGSLKLFDLIWVLTKGGPLHASEVPSTLMYTSIFTRMEYGRGSAMAIFIVLECLLFYFLIEKFFKVENTTY
ncbi:MAG: sugar ABC transporter permease [Lachnospiraceae bacterium]|jgi:raffinose/stachyose/melibiose transport system permease protein|nr:sugar ABC transporter permease [Lachnospiraceae bacterium]